MLAFVKAFSALFSLFLLFLLSLICQFLGLASSTRKFIIKGYRLTYKLAGLSINVYGHEVSNRSTLYVANHVSYFDILFLGPLLDASFIAKTEVGSWPLVGYIAKVVGTVFISRRKSKLMDEIAYLSKKIKQGRKFILFPEGTSSDGIRVLPFKSGFFSILQSLSVKDITIQPITLMLSHRQGLPVRLYQKKYYGWVGDETLISHLWRLCKMGPFTVSIFLHPPLQVTNQSRKELAFQLQRYVEKPFFYPPEQKKFRFSRVRETA